MSQSSLNHYYAEVLHNYKPPENDHHSEQKLCIQKKDVLLAMPRNDKKKTGWVFAVNQQTGAKGYVPLNYIKEMPQPVEEDDGEESWEDATLLPTGARRGQDRYYYPDGTIIYDDQPNKYFTDTDEVSLGPGFGQGDHTIRRPNNAVVYPSGYVTMASGDLQLRNEILTPAWELPDSCLPGYQAPSTPAATAFAPQHGHRPQHPPRLPDLPTPASPHRVPPAAANTASYTPTTRPATHSPISSTPISPGPSNEPRLPLTSPQPMLNTPAQPHQHQQIGAPPPLTSPSVSPSPRKPSSHVRNKSRNLSYEQSLTAPLQPRVCGQYQGRWDSQPFEALTLGARKYENGDLLFPDNTAVLKDYPDQLVDLVTEEVTKLPEEHREAEDYCIVKLDGAAQYPSNALVVGQGKIKKATGLFQPLWELPMTALPRAPKRMSQAKRNSLSHSLSRQNSIRKLATASSSSALDKEIKESGIYVDDLDNELGPPEDRHKMKSTYLHNSSGGGRSPEAAATVLTINARNLPKTGSGFWPKTACNPIAFVFQNHNGKLDPGVCTEFKIADSNPVFMKPIKLQTPSDAHNSTVMVRIYNVATGQTTTVNDKLLVGCCELKFAELRPTAAAAAAAWANRAPGESSSETSVNKPLQHPNKKEHSRLVKHGSYVTLSTTVDTPPDQQQEASKQDTEPSKQGYMSLHGTSHKPWKKRYFVLLNHALLVFKDKAAWDIYTGDKMSLAFPKLCIDLTTAHLTKECVSGSPLKQHFAVDTGANPPKLKEKDEPSEEKYPTHEGTGPDCIFQLTCVQREKHKMQAKACFLHADTPMEKQNWLDAICQQMPGKVFGVPLRMAVVRSGSEESGVPRPLKDVLDYLDKFLQTALGQEQQKQGLQSSSSNLNSIKDLWLKPKKKNEG
mmetsp:Transcript_23379/g.46087  ORF Transcript_23379/g.46087 Transcript_23379/m.46087 type:complete len:902 (-) Transcript_23379:608-3313(-)